eukprot:3265806-Rhodomonas_salina.3
MVTRRRDALVSEELALAALSLVPGAVSFSNVPATQKADHWHFFKAGNMRRTKLEKRRSGPRLNLIDSTVTNAPFTNAYVSLPTAEFADAGESLITPRAPFGPTPCGACTSRRTSSRQLQTSAQIGVCKRQRAETGNLRKVCPSNA